MKTLTPQTLGPNAVDFIDDDAITAMIDRPAPSTAELDAIIAKALDKQPLTVDETASLLAVTDPESIEQIFDAARELKTRVYGNRIVLFAPLYIGNECVNNCTYCAFRSSNKSVIRRTLTDQDIREQIVAMEDLGHKRIIAVFGEHSDYDAEYIADCVRTIYDTRSGNGEIRRVNINAAPLNTDEFKIVKESGIGTYQIFQETYHHATYERVHPPRTRKGNYLYRLDSLSRAIESGCDDVGVGALFGLADWRFEVLAMVTHALFLQERYGVGPHTLSFPRLRPAAGTSLDNEPFVDDEDFKRLVAILRLAVPYTGLILTSREPPALRREMMAFGVSQIDAGSRIELGGYTEVGDAQVMEREQFSLGDIRPLDVVMRELLDDGYVPSFCTSCYRLGRTGEHFMEFAVPGFIKRFCTPNALTTLLEYLLDYGTPETVEAGMRQIDAELAKLPEGDAKADILARLDKIKAGQRDLYL
jgi:2-iminoacetate synthase